MEYTGGGGRREGLVSCLMVFERDITLTGGGRGELGRDGKRWGGGEEGVGRRNFGSRKGGPCFILRTITTWCTFALLYI